MQRKLRYAVNWRIVSYMWTIDGQTKTEMAAADGQGDNTVAVRVYARTRALQIQLLRRCSNIYSHAELFLTTLYRRV